MSPMFPALQSARGEPARNAILARLLSDAVAALEGDAESARTALCRAVALVGQTATLPAHTRRGGLAPWQAKRTLALIDENIADGTRITALAAHVRLSKSHFSRAFKESFGCSPRQFITERQIQRAKELMITTDDRLCGVALACGFTDQAHFSRIFRRLEGRPPNAWRRTPVGD